MGIKYECSQCEKDKDSDIDGATVIYNDMRNDDEVFCDDCMDDMADRVRDFYKDQELMAHYKENV